MKADELRVIQRRVEQLTADLDAAAAERDRGVGEILAAGGISVRELGAYLGISGPRIVQINNRYRGRPKAGTDPRNPEKGQA